MSPNLQLPAFLQQGNGATAVFMLHGVGGGKEAWLECLPEVARSGYQAIAWDMPGYGASPMIDSYTNAGLARSLEHLIDHIGAHRNVVLGHSMGGMVAQEAVALFPHKINGLVLSGTSAAFGKPGGDWQQRFLNSRFAPLDAGMGMAGLARTLVRGMVAPDAGEQAVHAAERLMARVPESSYRAALSAIVSFSRVDNLSNIRVPALCIAGEHDQNATPAVMEKMAARIPGAQYVCLNNAGHLANMERPDAFNAVVLEFLKQHFSG